MNRKGNGSTEGNQISYSRRVLLRARWLTKNAADNLHYQSNLSPFSFSFSFTAFFSFFHPPSFSLPLSLQMGWLADEKEGSCASCERTAEARRRVILAAVGAGLVRRTYSRNGVEMT